MNLLPLMTVVAFLGAAGCVALAFWAMAERARATRAEDRARLVESQSAAGAELIKGQAAAVATAVAEGLVQRAEETFAAQQTLAQTRLEAQLKPVSDTLKKFEEQVTAAEKARAEQAGGLKAQIAQLMTASTATQDEARKLAAALRRGAGVQGRWGEQMLRNVLEMAGLQAGIDFEEQVHVDVEGSAHRPDVIVRLPGGAMFVIDAKCSLTAFLEAQDAPDELARTAAFARHAQSLRAHIQGLAARAYWDKLEMSPDFVAMFVPGDGFLAMALETLPALMTDGMERRVVIVTPTTLFALCKAVAYGWRIENQRQNADEIASLGRELYKRLSVMGGHVQAMGKALEIAIGGYNKFVGSLETQVLTQARRFEDLQADHEGRTLVELTPVETAVRPLAKLGPSVPAVPPVLTPGEAAPTSAA